MTEKKSILDIGTFVAVNGDWDPLNATFRYVARHEKGAFGLGALREVWETSTYPDIMRKIKGLRQSGKAVNREIADKLDDMSRRMEPMLDFTHDELGDHSALVLSGSR